MKTESAFFTDGEATGVMEGGVKKNGSWDSVWDLFMNEERIWGLRVASGVKGMLNTSSSLEL